MSKEYISSSKKDDWQTPPEVFDPLHERFGFTVDGAATDRTKRLPRFWPDAFAQSWAGERVWCNPPYGHQQRKFVMEAAKREAELSVFLIPARTDTKVWHEHIFPKAEVWFLRGRIRFINGAPPAPAPFPSALVFFRPDDKKMIAKAGDIDTLLSQARIT